MAMSQSNFIEKIKLFVILFLVQKRPAAAFENSPVTIPIGTILPVEKFQLQSIFNLVIRSHNVETTSSFGSNRPSIRFQAFLHTADVNNSYAVTSEFCNHVQHRSHAILGLHTRNTEPTLSSYSTTFALPWITMNPIFQDTSRTMLTSISPSLERPIYSLVQYHRWEQFAYFYFMNEHSLSMKSLIKFARQNKIKLHIHGIPSNGNVLPDLKILACKGVTNYVFDVGTEMSTSIMQQLLSMGMMTSEYHFVFTDLALAYQNLTKFSLGQANITMMDILDKSSSMYRTFLRKFLKENPNSKEIGYEGALISDAFTLVKRAMEDLLNKGFIFQYDIQKEISRQNEVACHQVPAVPLKMGMQISQAIRRTKFQGMTSLVEFDKNGIRKNYNVSFRSLDITGVYKAGEWFDSQNEYGVFKTTQARDHDKRLHHMMNKTIIVTTLLEEPYVMYRKDWKLLKGNDRFEGYCVDLLREIGKIVRMNFEFKLVDDGNYGSYDEKLGKWNGMIGEVRYQKAHMALAPLTITSTREAVVDFTKPFMSLGISIMIKKPEKSTPSIFSFMDPLSNEIWICILFAYTGVSVVLYLVSRFSPYEWHRESVLQDDNPEEEVDPATDFGIFNSLWFSLGSFMQQGADISPKSFSGRIVGGVWWFFTLIIVSSYTANLAAFLTVERMVSPIKGAEDLAKQTDIKYGTMYSGSTANFFKNSPIALYSKMWEFMRNHEPSVFVGSNKDGVERVRNSNGMYAFLMESTSNDYIGQRKPCNTMKVGPNLDIKGYGIALPKGSPIYDSINLAILKLLELGVLQKLKKHWWYDKSQCGQGKEDSQSVTAALALNNVAGVFYVLIFGLMMAIGAAVVEYVYKITKLKRKERFNKKLGAFQPVPDES